MTAVADFQRPGVLVTSLFQDQREEVRLETWEPNTEVNIIAPGGAELLVLSGSLFEGEDELIANSWLRVPINSKINAKAGDFGAKIWLKIGHLPFISIPSEATNR